VRGVRACDIAVGRLKPWVGPDRSVYDSQEDFMTAHVLLKGDQELVQGTLSRVEGKSTQSPVWVRLSNRNSCHFESTAATPPRLYDLPSRPECGHAIDTAMPVQLSETAGAWLRVTLKIAQAHLCTSDSLLGERAAF